MPDFTSLFAKSFAKYDEMKGAGVSVPHVRQEKVQLTEESDAIQKAYENSLHPERIGKKNFAEKQKVEAFYKSMLESITEDEYKNLVYLKSHDGRIIMTRDMLKSIGEAGEELSTDRLENWGLIKRDKIEDDLFEFRIKSLGKRVLSDINKIMEAKNGL